MAFPQSDVRALLDRWSEAVRSKDLERLMELYAPDSVYFDVVPPLRITGAAAIRQNFARWFASWESGIGVELRDVRILASEDVAVAYLLHQTSGTLINGQTVGYWVRVTMGCQRSAGGWLIAHEHISLPVDMASRSAVLDLEP